MTAADLVRVYLPMTPALLRAARDRGGFGPPPLRGHAVTPDLAAELGDADDEEREYAALTAAALASVALLGDDDPPVRVVAAVDVASCEPDPGEPGTVSVPHEVPWRRLAAVHVDDAAAGEAVAAARVVLRAGDDGEEHLERCLDHELGWYAAQEADALLASWSRPG